MTATTRNAAQVINQGIADLTATFMSRHGMTRDNAFDLAFESTLTMLATRRPDILERYLAAMVADHPELDPYTEAMDDLRADIDAYRASLYAPHPAPALP